MPDDPSPRRRFQFRLRTVVLHVNPLYPHLVIQENEMKTLSVVALCGAILFSGCGNASEPLASLKIGQQCVVQFRRDALGVAGGAPVSPDTGNFNGADVAIGGILKKAQADSILLATDRADYLIPIGAVLSLRFENPAPIKAESSPTK